MAVGAFRTTVLDVNDLATAEHFWMDITGNALDFLAGTAGSRGSAMRDRVPSSCNWCRSRRL